MIELPASLLDQIRRHGAEAYPEECCGGLFGERRESAVRVCRAEPVPNRRPDRRGNRFSIAPEDYLGLERLAEEAGLSLVGIYHSHPDHPAAPSDYDREHAFPFFHYLIVAVEAGRPRDVTCWVLSEDRGVFEREPLRSNDEE
jgi:proteasome lid subunit RPN8/RPN11